MASPICVSVISKAQAQEIVNNEISHKAGVLSRSPKSQANHRRVLAVKSDLEKLAQFLEAVEDPAKAEKPKIPEQLGFRFGSLDDLPEELRSDLNTGMDETETQVIAVLENPLGSVASVDEIRIALYRRYEVIHDRRKLMGKLYRMAKRGLLHHVLGKKGIYSTTPGLDLTGDAADSDSQSDDNDEVN